MNADDALFVAAMERDTVPTWGALGVPDRARPYVEAWARSVDHGCGHNAELRFTAIPLRSVLCAECAHAVGLLDRAMHCGRCRRPVDAARGDYAAAVAVSESTIAFLALCAECMSHLEEGNE